MASNEEADPRTSIQHVLDDDSKPPEPSIPKIKPEDANDRPPSTTPAKVDPDALSDSQTPQYTSTTTTIRRNANGSVSSVYSGNKIRHLKKEDGVPLWRKDIQYDFLKYVFEDEKKAFHKASDKSFGHTFADIYLDAMAQSSKCSKILKEKLLSDRPAAVNMAMVCLLVNVGRMNTTLNFFPEMRAQLRTYHSIPSLQLSSHQDPNAYKQLQDAPRLKSILKGATEDTEQPGTIEDIKAAAIPRTNPVNLIFVLAQFAPKISEIHFDVPRDFFDLVMKEQLSSRSRATAFLWLMWWYLESDFTLEAALNNPYGPGRRSRNSDVKDLPLLCPQFDFLTEEQAALENVDVTEEREFGELKQQERVAILNGDMAPVYTGPKRNKKSYASNPVFSVNSLSNDDAGSPGVDVNSPAYPVNRARSKPVQPSIKPEDTDSDETVPASPTRSAIYPDSSSKLGRGKYPRSKEPHSNLRPKAGVNYAILNGDESQGPSSKRSRPPTTHQMALEQYRKDRVNHILDRGLRDIYIQSAKQRRTQTGISLAARRINRIPLNYDSEEEAHMTAAGRVGAAKMGVVMGGYRQGEYESEDFGEEMTAVAQAFRRLRRRLARFEGDDLSSFSRRAKGKRRETTYIEDDAMDLDDDDDMEMEDSNLRAIGDDEWSDGSI
jgi:Ino eighty subunit 1